MAAVLAMASEKIYTEASAFGIGILNGLISRSRPTASLLTTSVTAIGGLVGSMMTRGRMADVLEGVAAGSLGALGYSIPYWFMAPAGSTGRARIGGARQIAMVNAPKALGGGLGRSPAPAYAEEFEGAEIY